MGCCDSKESAPASAAHARNAAVGKKSGTALSPMGTGATTSTTNAAATAAPNARNGQRSGGAVGGVATPQEQNRVRAAEKAVAALVESFKSNETLVPSANWRRQFVKVAGIGPYVAAAIADKLSGKGAAQGMAKQPAKHGILTLDLRAMKIGDGGLASLSKALALDTVVENVILPGNQISDVGAKSFVTAITAASSGIVNGNSAASGGGGGEGGGSSTNANGTNGAGSSGCPSQMRLLVLSDNPISSSGLSALASCLDRLTKLERLEIGRGQTSEEHETEEDPITDEAAQALVRLIDASPSLQTLVFKGTGNPFRTDFSPASLSAFVQKVVGESRLRALFLQECFTTKPIFVPTTAVPLPRRKGTPPTPAAPPPVGDASAYLQPIRALATALTVRTTQLSTLVLRFPLTDSAVAALCSGVAHAILVANLSLRGCDMSATALRSLADALRVNRTISTLDISYQSSLIAHPAVLQEMRSSSRQRQTEYRDSIGSSGTGTDSVPSREEREHPLLPIIQVLHTNRTITQLIMFGVNIQVDDVEELCSCIEQSGNHVLTDVAYTSIGADALSMKLENFLSANREYGNDVGLSVSRVSLRSGVREGSLGNLFADTVTERSQASEYANRGPSATGGRTAGTYFLSVTAPHAGARVEGPRPAQTAPAAGKQPRAQATDRTAPGQTSTEDITTLDDVELRVGSNAATSFRRGSPHAAQEASSELDTAPYLSKTRNRIGGD